MSGIILPGKEPKASGGGIELPKGFARKRSDEEQAPPVEPAVPAAPAEDAAAEAPEQPAGRRQGRGADLLFPPAGAQVQCPNCGTPYVVPVFTIIDLGANPELLSALLGGQVNMAMCPSCGAGGPLNAPLLVHDPGHDFLGVYAPAVGLDDLQRQKMIGDLTQALMRKLPAEQRRGYMLQPKEYADWQRFVERLWEFQGVTPEMLRRQRMQTEALQTLLRLADDPQALDIALERHRDLIDRQFFTLLDRLMVLASSQGDGKTAEQLMALRTQLLERTEAGQEIKALQDQMRAVLDSIPPTASRDQILDTLLTTWQGPNGREIVSSLAVALAPAMDNEFLLAIAGRIDRSTDAAEQTALEELRSLVVDIQEQQRESAQSVMAQAQELLQAVLEAPDAQEALEQNADLIDEPFLALLAGNIDRAEKSKATAAVRRLREIYDLALNILQDRMPPELRLVNQLVNAPDEGAMRKLLQDNRSLLNPQFLDTLRGLEDDFRSRGSADVADRLKSIRGQAQLMV